MSHSTHVFLINDAIDLGDAMLMVDNSFVNTPPSDCDYFRVLGAIDFKTDEYKEWTQLIGSNPNKIRSKNDLEQFANSLYSKEDWDRLKSDLERFVKSDLFWNAKCVCERLDGMNYARALGFPKWKANIKDSFAINDGYFYMDGITDWRSIEDASEADFEPANIYAVIVDFHS